MNDPYDFKFFCVWSLLLKQMKHLISNHYLSLPTTIRNLPTTVNYHWWPLTITCPTPRLTPNTGPLEKMGLPHPKSYSPARMSPPPPPLLHPSLSTLTRMSHFTEICNSIETWCKKQLPSFPSPPYPSVILFPIYKHINILHKLYLLVKIHNFFFQ